MASQVKSKQRVADHGEVFTAEREVKAMCDLVSDECLRIDSRFLEPACGDGNFLAEILTRKLTVVTQKYKRNPVDYEKNALLALGSLYGVELLTDNVAACRERLFKIWDKAYTKAVKKIDRKEPVRESARYILEKNIICGNALSMMCVDENQQDTAQFITFTEWSFPANDARIKRREFRLDVLLRENDDESNYQAQFSIFGDDAMDTENWMIDPITNETVPRPIREYPPINYRKLGEQEA